jgi:subtilisin family serine protease
VGDLTSFSSRGPTMDGRQKPELVAPGAWVISSRSGTSWVQNFLIYTDGVHEASVGTSFAAPHAAGVAALLLAINPTLTWQEVRSALIEGAGEDAFTPPLPDLRWGYGKLSAASTIPLVEPPDDGDDDDEPIGPIQVEATTNPATDLATFAYSVPEQARLVWLRIYSIDGRLVQEIDVDPQGESVDWTLVTRDGELVGSGLYLYVLVTDVGRSAVERLVVLR